MSKKHFIAVYAFRILLILAIVELGLRASGLVHAGLQRHYSIGLNASYRILTLGESNTADLHNGQSSWPRELNIMLNRNGKKRYAVFNEGTPSSNSEIIIRSFEKNLDKYKPDMVIAMMGGNDWQIEHKDSGTSGSFLPAIAELRVYKLANEGKNSLVKSIEDLKKAKTFYEADTEATLEEKMRQRPDSSTLVTLLLLYDFKNKPEKAVALASRNVSMIIDNPAALEIVGKSYYNLGNYTMALKYFLNSLERRPGHFETLIQLSDTLLKLNETGQAKTVLYKMEMARPQLHVLLRLARINLMENDTINAYNRLGTAIFYQPDLVDEIFMMGNLYESLNQTNSAVELFETTAKRNPGNYAALTELAWHHMKNNRTLEAENELSLIKSIGDERLEEAFRRISEKYTKKGQPEKAAEMLSRARELGREKAKITRKNYNMMLRIARGRGIKMVAVQYPLLDPDELRQYFDSDVPYIVSNKVNFEKALANSTYEDYFIDRSGYKYGHGTIRGNRLIAENVAHAVISIAES